MYTKKEMMTIVKKQLAVDMSCTIQDLEQKKTLVIEKKQLEGRRIYGNDGCFLKILCLEEQVIMSAQQPMIEWCQSTYGKAGSAWFFGYPNLKKIDRKLEEYGHEIADAHHYYLPDIHAEDVEPIVEVRWYEAEEILGFKDDERFEEALAFDPTHPDVLAVAALCNGEIVGMAGASADSESMWQIGIDVTPEYRGKGIAANLVALLKQEILKRGKVPFYGTVESHIASQNVAIKAGFVPAWAELYSRKVEC